MKKAIKVKYFFENYTYIFGLSAMDFSVVNSGKIGNQSVSVLKVKKYQMFRQLKLSAVEFLSLKGVMHGYLFLVGTNFLGVSLDVFTKFLHDLNLNTCEYYFFRNKKLIRSLTFVSFKRKQSLFFNLFFCFTVRRHQLFFFFKMLNYLIEMRVFSFVFRGIYRDDGDSKSVIA